MIRKQSQAIIRTSRETMSHAFGEMYYLATLTEQRRQKLAERKEKKDPHTGLVFISPRVPKEFDIVVPSDTGKSVETTIHTDDPCIIA